MMRRLLLATCAMALLAESGCATFDRAEQLHKDTLNTIDQAAPPTTPVFERVAEPYLRGTAVARRAVQPEALNRDIILVVSPGRSLREIASLISEKVGVPIDVDLSGPAHSGSAPSSSSSAGSPALPPPPSALMNALSGGADSAIAVNYHGAVAGLLDHVAERAGVSWRYDAGRIVMFDVESRTFEIPALAWRTSTKGAIVASAGPSSAAGGSSSANGSASAVVAGSSEIDNSGDMDVWKDLQKVAETVTGGTRVVADSSLGSLTVTGTPSQIRRATAWVDELSASLTRQVALEIHIYTIKLNDEQNYGFSPNLSFKSGQFSLSSGGPSVPVIQGSASPLTFGGNILSGPFSGATAAVQALATLGSVTQDYEQTAVSLNGQPVPIQVGQQTGYLASVSTTLSTNVGSTSSLTPGSITTGFTGLFVPRVAGDHILLGMNVTIQSLVSLTTVSSGASSIQTPTTANSTFQQSVSLPAGSTLLLTGFKNNNAGSTRNGVFTPEFFGLGGGADATYGRQMVAILINARTL